MLEYRAPRPHPGPKWYTERHSAIWERRRPDSGPSIPIAEHDTIARARGVTIALSLHAHPASVTVRLRVQMQRRGSLRAALSEPPDELPDDFLRLGVQFSDGMVATNLPGAFWMAPADGPLFIGDASGNSSTRHWELSWTLWPLPPPGPVVVAVALPAYGIPESLAIFDGSEIRAAAERSAAAGWRGQPDPPLPAWRTRTADDPPLRWHVEVWLKPLTPRTGWDATIANIVKTAGIDIWDGSDADAWDDEHRAARDAAPDPENFGYIAHYRGAYRLELTQTASTYENAIAQAKKRLGLPEGWSAQIHAEPSSNR